MIDFNQYQKMEIRVARIEEKLLSMRVVIKKLNKLVKQLKKKKRKK